MRHYTKFFKDNQKHLCKYLINKILQLIAKYKNLKLIIKLLTILFIKMDSKKSWIKNLKIWILIQLRIIPLYFKKINWLKINI